MKFACGPSWYAKVLAKEKWHVWFAWRPVRVAEGDCRWLEYVVRKGRYGMGGWNWDYYTLAEPPVHREGK